MSILNGANLVYVLVIKILSFMSISGLKLSGSFSKCLFSSLTYVLGWYKAIFLPILDGKSRVIGGNIAWIYSLFINWKLKDLFLPSSGIFLLWPDAFGLMPLA